MGFEMQISPYSNLIQQYHFEENEEEEDKSHFEEKDQCEEEEEEESHCEEEEEEEESHCEEEDISGTVCLVHVWFACVSSYYPDEKKFCYTPGKVLSAWRSIVKWQHFQLIWLLF